MEHQPPVLHCMVAVHQKQAQYLTEDWVSPKNINLDAWVSVQFHNAKAFLFFKELAIWQPEWNIMNI